MLMNTTIAGRTWTLVNCWENTWHWACTSDATMNGKIVTASNFTEAIAALKAKLQIPKADKFHTESANIKGKEVMLSGEMALRRREFV